MHRAIPTVVCAVLALLASGCGSSGSGEAAGDNDVQRQSRAEPTKPDVVVFEFLEAVRTGDDEKAAELLTSLARQKTAEFDMIVAPPGSDTARFEVTEVDRSVGDGAVHVGSTWTDVDELGNEHTEKIVWILRQEILRQETVGWRIAGMATKVFDDQPPLFLNFENPEEMMRKQELVEQEIERRAEQPYLQTRKPDAPVDPKLR